MKKSILTTCPNFGGHHKIPDDVKRDYLSQARGIGCDVDKLVWVKQDKQQ